MIGFLISLNFSEKLTFCLISDFHYVIFKSIKIIYLWTIEEPS